VTAYVTRDACVELYDDGGKLLEVAGPFDDLDDAELAAERILRVSE
jgi:hypothetical protein